jgi:hypothetical protein
MLSTNGGKSGLITGIINGNSLPLADKSYSWVVGSEDGSGAPFFPPPSTQCILRVSNYNVTPGLYDDSGIFSVQ